MDKKSLEHLAKLARIELKENEEEGLINDLQKILDHFEELKAVETSSVEPMSGGTTLKNTLREDGERKSTNLKKGSDSFPEEKESFLKIPPVFKNDTE